MAWKKRVITLLLSRLNPSGTALLAWLGPRVDDTLLHEIAGADYGHNQNIYFQALVPIRDRQDIPAPLPWEPREVLNLTRWSEPHEPSQGFYSMGTRGHLARAFSCAVLLKAADDLLTRDYIDAENDTLIQMIASVLHLGNEATEAASRFLCWRILRLPLFDGEAPFFTLALLLLRAALFRPGDDGTDLKLLADWVGREEMRSRRMLTNSSTIPEEWLLGLTTFDQRHEVWKRVSEEVLADPSKEFPEPAASAMHGILSRLVPGPT